MSEVTPPAGAFYAGDVQARAAGTEAGMVRFGGVAISATDAAEFVMMHRTQVMKKVGADRTELAQQHLDRIKTARQYLTDLIDLKKFSGNAESYHGRVPVTPDMITFLKDEVGASPGTDTNRVVYYGRGVQNLPQSVRDYYGFGNDGHGTGGDFDTYETSKSRHDSHVHDRYETHGVTIINEDDIDSLKEEMNNYIDQQNDSNNLFMTKFKSVINAMNEALEGANSMADKSHDTVKSLVSRW